VVAGITLICRAQQRQHSHAKRQGYAPNRNGRDWTKLSIIIVNASYCQARAWMAKRWREKAEMIEDKDFWEAW